MRALQQGGAGPAARPTVGFELNIQGINPSQRR
jgi:hypothetical protein